MRISHLYFGILLALSFVAVSTAGTIRTVVLSGDPALHAGSGVIFAGLYSPVINEKGTVAFKSKLAGNGVVFHNENSIWTGNSGFLQMAVRSGMQAEGAPTGQNYRDFSDLHINKFGKVAFSAVLIGNGVNPDNIRGIWTNGRGSLELVARNGDQAPGTESGIRFSGHMNPLFSDYGRVTFRGSLAGSGVDNTNDNGIWSDSSGILELIAREGDYAPGTPAGVTFGTIDATVVNTLGKTTFHASLFGNGIDNTNDQGVWLGDTNSLNLVARTGDQASGTPVGVNFSNFRKPVINNAGQVAVLAELTGIGIDNFNENGIWSGASDSLELIVRTGDPAAGTLNGETFQSIGLPIINSAGKTAFFASLAGNGVTDTNENGIWVEREGTLDLVARTGDHAPGTPDGVTFSELDFSLPAFNSFGQVAFAASLTGGDVHSENDAGIWAVDRSGKLQLIVRDGDLLEVAPGDFRTVRYVNFRGSSGNEDGRQSGFNNLGQLVFQAYLSDGVGIFVSDLATVPEPSSIILVVVLAVCTVTVRRHSH